MKKYLHIIDQVSPNFTYQTILLINGALSLKEQSKFITSDIKLLNKVPQYDNVVFENDIVKYINNNYKKFDFIFIHAMNFSIKQLIRINSKAIRKVIWCVWGHDLYTINSSQKGWEKIKLKIKEYCKHIILKNIYGVGIGFGYDAIEVRKKVGDNPRIFLMPYGYQKGMKEQYEKIYNEKKDNNFNCKIMIGHSGYEFLNHIEIMKKLIRFKDQNIIISLVLAYGDNEYIKKVKEFAYNNFEKNKIEIIENLYTDEQYMRYLNSVDVAIFDYTHQAALGNIWKLSYLEKRMFLKDRGILKTAFDLEFLYSNDIRELDTISFEEISSMLPLKEKEKLHKYGELYMDDESIKELWNKVFRYLENE